METDETCRRKDIDKDWFKILDLPLEILSNILDLVVTNHKHDLINLSCTCTAFRRLCSALLFKDVHLNWSSIEVFKEHILQKPSNIRQFVTVLEIHPANIKGEWHKSAVLEQVLNSCPIVTELKLTISGSSNWLKYFNVPGSVCKLSVVSNISLSCRGNADNSKLILPAFDLGDLARFNNLSTLNLEGFNVQIYESCPDLRILNLHLVNCIWAYPHKIEECGPVERLSLTYTDSYRSFTCKFNTPVPEPAIHTDPDSERLKSLAQSPPPNVKHLSLHLLQRSPLGQKAWHPMPRNCSQIESLSLIGFDIPGSDFVQDLPQTLRVLKLGLCMFTKRLSEFNAMEMRRKLSSKNSLLQVCFRIEVWEDSNSGPKYAIVL